MKQFTLLFQAVIAFVVLFTGLSFWSYRDNFESEEVVAFVVLFTGLSFVFIRHLNPIESRIDRIESRIDRIESRIDSIEKKLDKLIESKVVSSSK